jgi:hypothetical protein
LLCSPFADQASDADSDGWFQRIPAAAASSNAQFTQVPGTFDRPDQAERRSGSDLRLFDRKPQACAFSQAETRTPAACGQTTIHSAT